MFGAQKEINRINYLFENEEKIVDLRYKDCQEWYIKKACMYKWLYYILMVFMGLSPIIITGIETCTCISINNDCLWQIIKITLSILTSFSVLLLNLTRAQEHWTLYRQAAETLKRIRAIYLIRCKKNPGSIDNDENFLKEIEDYMKVENTEWKEKAYSEMQKKKK